MGESKLTIFEAESLAMHLCGIDEDSDEAEDADLDELLQDRYGFGFDGFCAVVADLLPLIDVAGSLLAGKAYQGFAAKGEGNYRRWLARMERGGIMSNMGEHDMPGLIRLGDRGDILVDPASIVGAVLLGDDDHADHGWRIRVDVVGGRTYRAAYGSERAARSGLDMIQHACRRAATAAATDTATEAGE